MDAVEYIKTLRKLCKSQERCSGCVLYDKEDKCCILNISEYTEKSVQIVEQWAKEHPIKTRQSEFLRMFPNAQIHDDVIWMCPRCIEGKRIGCPNEKNCGDCRREYWLAEVTDNGNVY